MTRKMHLIHMMAISFTITILLTGCKSPSRGAYGKGKSSAITTAINKEPLPSETTQPDPASPIPAAMQFAPTASSDTSASTHPAETASAMDIHDSINRTTDTFPELPSRNLDQEPEKPKTPIYSLPMDMTRDIENPDDAVEVKFNFDAENLINVIQMFSVTLNFQYFIDPAVTGSVTMTIDTKMTRREAWELFEHILWISGAYASKNFAFINILPFSKMPQERRLFATHDPIPNVQIEIIKLYHTPAPDIVNLIKPFMTAGATASAIQYLNSILIIEAPPNMPKLRELIERLDVVGESKWPLISLPCHFVEAQIILEELQVILPMIGFPVTSGERSDGHSIKLVALDRLQVIIAAAPAREVLDEIARWIAILDREDTAENERIYFYDVKYNKAEDLSESIGVFFNSSSTATSSRSSNRSSRSSATTANNETASTPPPARNVANDQQNNRRTTRTRSSAQRSGSSDEIPATIFDIPVTVLADGAHNRLVIRTTARAYTMLEALLQRLDIPPLQVLINVIIAEIKLSKNTEYGFRFAAKPGGDFKFNINPSGSDDVGSKDLYNMVLSSNSNGSITNIGDVFSFVKAIAGKTNTRVLSSPQIIAISDEEATINIGKSVPIITEQLNNTSGNAVTGNINQSIQYKDTGTILKVTPHITAKKLVTLDISQEYSVAEAIPTDANAIRSPAITNRVLETSMVVKDKTTVLLGGFIENSNTNGERKIPVLGDIPYLGKLFSYSTTTNGKTELLLILNVNVIDVETDFGNVLKKYHNSLQAINENFADTNNELPPNEMRQKTQ